MDKVLQCNPILEAFGNAKTIRNDNSSRFGRFMDLYFNKNGLLIGAIITTYLLEKVRICTHSKGEQNYHVFHEMVACPSAEDAHRWELPSASDLYYINQGGVTGKTGKNNEKGKLFTELKAAMSTLKFPEASRVSAFDILAALLHIGQIELVDDGKDGSQPRESASVMLAVSTASKLLGVTGDALIKAITVKVAFNKSFEKNLSKEQALMVDHTCLSTHTYHLTHHLLFGM
jgi:myosin heavy subunit